MPRWASRITLEITGVRVERLQEISEADAKAEGVTAAQPVELDGGHQFVTPAHRRSYARLLDQINGPGSWDANPFVWCLTFRRIEP